MGMITDAKIARFKERLARGEVSYQPAQGAALIALNKAEAYAREFIRILPLEKSGERDGDGYWSGSNPIDGLPRAILEAYQEYERIMGWCESDEKMGSADSDRDSSF